MAAVTQNCEAINHLKRNDYYYAIYLTAVKKGASLECIEKKLRTDERFKTVISRDISELKHVIETYQICEIWMKKVELDGLLLGEIPPRDRADDVYNLVPTELCQAIESK